MIGLISLLTLGPAQAAGMMTYDSAIVNAPGEQTTILWNITDCPDVPFAWGWEDEGKWSAEPGDTMSFAVNTTNADVEGELHLGNFSIYANDTDIARELVLGVWGATPFFPGLVIEVDNASIQRMNATAYASAERVKGNYLNGTMESYYSNMTVEVGTFQCIVFAYVQDDSGWGEPQRTTLAYDLETGVLVWGNTSYSFGTPYILTLELKQIAISSSGINALVVGGSIGAVAVILVLVVVIMKRR